MLLGQAAGSGVRLQALPLALRQYGVLAGYARETKIIFPKSVDWQESHSGGREIPPRAVTSPPFGGIIPLPASAAISFKSAGRDSSSTADYCVTSGFGSLDVRSGRPG